MDATEVTSPVVTRVLVVEDSATQASLIEALLVGRRTDHARLRPVATSRAPDLGSALARIVADAGAFDVVLLDLGLPDSSGLDTLAAVRRVTDLPVVVLTATAEADRAVAALSEGAQDFVHKDRESLVGLPRALRYAATRGAMVRELEAALAAREAADARLAAFVGAASHELRSPISAVRSMTMLLRERWDQLEDDARRSMVARVDDRLRHTEQVATLFLNAANTGELRTRPEVVDVADVARSVATSVAVPPDEVRVEPGEVVVDRSHLEAVLANLVTNATKHGQGPVHLVGDRSALTVVDHGTGVPPEAVATLFTPWHSAAAEGVDSTGLGLSLSAQLAEVNDCSLTYRRVRDQTRFQLLLPARATS